MTNSIQWLAYSILPDIYVEFYQKSYNAISATTLLGSISMIVMILPVRVVNFGKIELSRDWHKFFWALKKLPDCSGSKFHRKWAPLQGKNFRRKIFSKLQILKVLYHFFWRPTHHKSRQQTTSVFLIIWGDIVSAQNSVQEHQCTLLPE